MWGLWWALRKRRVSKQAAAFSATVCKGSVTTEVFRTLKCIEPGVMYLSVLRKLKLKLWHYGLLQCLSILSGSLFTTACCVVRMRMEETSLSLEDSWKCVEKPQPTSGGPSPLVLGGDVTVMRHEKERNQHVTNCCIEPQTGTNFGRELNETQTQTVRWVGHVPGVP